MQPLAGHDESDAEPRTMNSFNIEAFMQPLMLLRPLVAAHQTERQPRFPNELPV